MHFHLLFINNNKNVLTVIINVKTRSTSQKDPDLVRGPCVGDPWSLLSVSAAETHRKQHMIQNIITSLWQGPQTGEHLV